MKANVKGETPPRQTSGARQGLESTPCSLTAFLTLGFIGSGILSVVSIVGLAVWLPIEIEMDGEAIKERNSLFFKANMTMNEPTPFTLKLRPGDAWERIADRETAIISRVEDHPSPGSTIVEIVEPTGRRLLELGQFLSEYSQHSHPWN